MPLLHYGTINLLSLCPSLLKSLNLGFEIQKCHKIINNECKNDWLINKYIILNS
jgi:hypothetical protein